jgi:hypothetical protein
VIALASFAPAGNSTIDSIIGSIAIGAISPAALLFLI